MSKVFNDIIEDIEERKKEVVKRLSRAFYEEIEAEASKSLNTLRDEYLDAVIIEEELDSISVSLDESNELVHKIEEGSAAYDLKEGFRNSPNTKEGEEGWYLDIPFKMATNPSRAIPKGYSGAMPYSVYKTAKEKGEVTVKDLKSPFDKTSTRAAFTSRETQQTFPEYKHKSPIFEGIKKYQDEKRKNSSKYVKFRRVSENSDPASWIHQGFAALGIFDLAVQRTEAMREQIIKDVMEK